MSAPEPVSADENPTNARASSWVIPFLCFFLSGASGLVFEVIWTRMLTLVFGASTPAISTVLSAFMGGLALGSFLFGRLADRLRFPILSYAAIEAGVGVFALLIPLIVRGVYPPFSHWVTNHGGNRFDVFTLLRFVVVALLLLPPTTLMGATLPLLARHFVKQGGTVGQRVGALYAVNTFGAVAGTFAAGFFLLPQVGLAWTNAIAGATNVTLAVLIVLFRKQLLGAVMPTSWRDLLPQKTALEPVEEPAKATAKEGDDEDDDAVDEVISKPARVAVLLAAGGSGFAALAYEVILSRALDMVIGSSIYSFTIILMGFLIGIGGGSALASWILRVRPSPAATAAVAGTVEALALFYVVSQQTNLSRLVWAITTVVVLLGTAIAASRRKPVLALGVTQLLIAGGAIVTYFFQDRIPRMFVYLAMTATTNCSAQDAVRFSEHVGTIQWLSFVVALLCALPAAIGMGAAFPLGIRARPQGAARIGGDTSRVYAVNTVGSILGSLLTGFAIMPAVGMETAMYIAVAMNLALALALFLASSGEEPVKYALVPLAAVLLAVTSVGAVLGRDGRIARSRGALRVFPRAWDQAEMTTGVFRLSLADGMIHRQNGRCIEDAAGDRSARLGPENPIYYRDGVTTTVTVERWAVGGDRIHFALKNNGKVDASNGDDMPTQVLVAGYPLLLHPRGPQNLDVAVVGFGSGVTIGTALQFPVRRVDVVELERWIPDASRYFADINHLTYTRERVFPFVEAPRMTLINNDGRNYLATTDRRYDVVISEPSNPWITGVSNLFTEDHWRAAMQSLRPDGIFVQWVQLYEMHPRQHQDPLPHLRAGVPPRAGLRGRRVQLRHDPARRAAAHRARPRAHRRAHAPAPRGRGPRALARRARHRRARADALREPRRAQPVHGPRGAPGARRVAAGASRHGHHRVLAVDSSPPPRAHQHRRQRPHRIRGAARPHRLRRVLGVRRDDVRRRVALRHGRARARPRARPRGAHPGALEPRRLAARRRPPAPRGRAARTGRRPARPRHPQHPRARARARRRDLGRDHDPARAHRAPRPAGARTGHERRGRPTAAGDLQPRPRGGGARPEPRGAGGPRRAAHRRARPLRPWPPVALRLPALQDQHGAARRAALQRGGGAPGVPRPR
ncbi:MAG: fused MFS/spermidine synthase [Polyangiales bacterium]